MSDAEGTFMVTFVWENNLVRRDCINCTIYGMDKLLSTARHGSWLRNNKKGKKENTSTKFLWSLYKHKQSFALRFSGVLLSSLVRPAVMILASLVSCVMAALLLSLTAATSLALLYTGVGVIGFFISLQFASGHLKHLCWTCLFSTVTFTRLTTKP